jgi:hypothetical protein
MYLAGSFHVDKNSCPHFNADRLAESMWARLVLSLHILFHAQTLLYAPLCSAGSIPPANSTTSVTVQPTESASLTAQPTHSTATVHANETSSVSTLVTSSSTSSIASTTSISLNITSTSSTISIQPTQTIDPTTLHDIQLIASRRLSSIIGAITTSASSITGWWDIRYRVHF